MLEGSRLPGVMPKNRSRLRLRRCHRRQLPHTGVSARLEPRVFPISMSPRLRTRPKSLHGLLINIDIDGHRPLSTPQRPLSLRGGNRCSCPLRDLAGGRGHRPSWVDCGPSRFAWPAVPMLCKRTFANRRRGSHQTGAFVPTSPGSHSSLSASTRAGLASSAIPDKVNDPIAVAMQSADAGFHHLSAGQGLANDH